MMPQTYLKRFGGFGCFNPECKSGLEIEVHHIIPKSKGGKNEYENYIILCRDCHRGKNNHSNFKDRITALWTYKFYFESFLKYEKGTLNGLPELSKGNTETPDDQGKDHSEVLRQEMPVDLPQQLPKKPASGIRKRAKQSPKKIRDYKYPLIFCFLPGCNTEFTPKNKLQKFCSVKCKRELERREYLGSKVFSEILLTDKLSEELIAQINRGQL